MELAFGRPDLRECVAASALQHVADGWSYLGTALQATARGDGDHALHLAYYASLRAALGIMATRGVAVLNSKHFVIGSAAPALIRSPRRRGTHEMAWLATEHWFGRTSAGDALARLVRPGGLPMSEWMSAAYAGHPWRRIAKDWLASWGTDLQRFGKDQFLRNASSYSPGGMSRTATATEAASFVASVWEALQPTSFSPFERLDRHLLRRALEQLEVETTGNRPPTNAFDMRVNTALGRLALPPITAGWQAFMTRQSEPEDLAVITAAAANTFIWRARTFPSDRSRVDAASCSQGWRRSCGMAPM